MCVVLIASCVNLACLVIHYAVPKRKISIKCHLVCENLPKHCQGIISEAGFVSRQCRGQALSIIELLYLYNAENTKKKRKEREPSIIHFTLRYFILHVKEKALTGLAAQSPAPITLALLLLVILLTWQPVPLALMLSSCSSITKVLHLVTAQRMGSLTKVCKS